MTDFILFYIGIGFVLNLAFALFYFYRGSDEGYTVLPHPTIFFLTIFSWPKTLWDLIAQITSKEK
jgi:hypothetical protein